MPETDGSTGRTDLEQMLELLARRFEFDRRGRLLTSRTGDSVPRFIFGRTFLGCLWRFRHDLDEELVVGLARMAGREGPLPRTEPGCAAAPERLVVMQRLLDDPQNAAPPRHEWIEHGGVYSAELWIFD